jgi:hypothetical protein
MVNPLWLINKANYEVKLIVDGELDSDQDLQVTLEAYREHLTTYLSRTQVTELRDHLTTILKTPEPMYRYLIKEFNDTPHGVISTGTVDNAGLELLTANTPAGHVLKYELLPD